MLAAYATKKMALVNVHSVLESHVLAGLSRAAAIVLILLLLSTLLQISASIYTHVESSGWLYHLAKVFLLVCHILNLLDSWMTRAVKWAIFSQWPETGNILRAYWALAAAAVRRAIPWCAEECLLKEPATKE